MGHDMTRVRLTFAARQRFPDIGTAHGKAILGTFKFEEWLRVEWPGDRTTWLRAEDLEPVTQSEEPNP